MIQKGQNFGMRRLRSWTRSPGYYATKAKERIFGVGASFFGNHREVYRPGSYEWLALTENLYGGLQTTAVHRGGDRMSPYHHNYGRCYAEFLKKIVENKGSDRLTLVEVGILKGTGLAIWCDLFPNARVIGLDIDLSNFENNRKRLESLGAFQKNKPELYEFDQLNPEKAANVLSKVLGDGKVDIAIDDGCHSIESIEITLRALTPYFSPSFVYFIEDNFDTYDSLSAKFSQFDWATRGEIAVVVSR